jgi:hypothetical protein
LAVGRAGYLLHMSEYDIDRDRLRRRAAYLREIAEAKALRERVSPRRARRAKANQLHRMLTYRHC